jgi:hypothetical protein
VNDVTLSIVSHGHGALLRALLTDLSALPGARALRVLVTLNLPGEDFDPRGFPALQIEVLRSISPRGFGANHNAAFARCVTPWFVVLNPDIRLPRDPFEALLRAAESVPDVALLSPQVLSSSGTIEDHIRSNLTLPSLLRRRRGIVDIVDSSEPCRPPGRFYWLAGMFMLFRSQAFREVGGFHERFFLYCEDYDICARLYARGYGLAVVPQASVVHDAQRDSHRSLKHLQWHIASIAKVWSSRVFWRITLGL